MIGYASNEGAKICCSICNRFLVDDVILQRAKHVYTEAKRVHDFRAVTVQSERYSHCLFLNLRCVSEGFS